MLSKKLTTTLMALSLSVCVFAEDGNQAQISTVPSPVVSTKALEVKITTSDLGSEVYCYTWCADINGKEKKPSWTWDGVNSPNYKMTGSNGNYSFKIDNIQSFYELTATDLQGLKKLGFIAKNRAGNKTVDLFVTVEQGAREAYAGGEGTITNPFVLTTPAHLVEFSTSAQDWSSDIYVKLGADINAASLTSPIGNTSTPYQGHFDGNGHTISNFTLTSTKLGTPVGLFGVIKGAEIKSLGVKNACAKGVNNVGILVGTAESGLIDRCFTTGEVFGGSICVGGLVGENVSAVITDCYSGVRVNNPNDFATGGITGKNQGVIRNVYATGEISGKDYVGGIAGANYGVIRYSVALNNTVQGGHEYTARFGGNDNPQNKTESNHSWEGIAPYGASWTDHGDHATLKNSGDLGQATVFKSLTGWDFDNVWEWKESNSRGYPVLRNLANQENLIPETFYGSSGVEEIIESNGIDITAGPNPFTDAIFVRSTGSLSRLEVYSVSGMLQTSLYCNGETECVVNMSGAMPGIYVVNVTAKDGSKSIFKLIKK